MNRVKKVLLLVCVLSMCIGAEVSAATDDIQMQNVSEDAVLWVGDSCILLHGELTGEMPENVSYDLETNVLTLDNYNPESGSGGISANYMGSDFTIRLIGENNIAEYTDGFSGTINTDTNLTIEGPGSLNLMDVGTAGINCSGDADLTISNCTLNITGRGSGDVMFYGINGSLDAETEITINKSDINIQSNMPSGIRNTNAGIDTQKGNLTVNDSNIDIELTNGNIFGLAIGQSNSDGHGGNIIISNSVIQCMTSTDAENNGTILNHNMYFYNMVNSNSLYYYALEDGAFVEKAFDSAFSYSGRYNAGTSMIISSEPISDYCAHKWDSGVVTKDATCTEKGEIAYTCTVCGEKRIEETEASGHEWGEWQTVQEATCTEQGTKERTCSRCSETEMEKVPAQGHDPVSTTAIEPTCTEDGLEKTVCSRCNLEIGEKIIPATGHKYEWTVEKEASFNEDGVKTGTCIYCGDVKTEIIPRLSLSHEHDFSGKEEIVKPATCTEEGSKNIYCTEPECGEYITEAIPMTEHTPGEWKTVKEASCSENGLEERTCSECGAVIETRITDKTEHVYGEWKVTIPATCTETGTETAECTVCGEITTRIIKATGHSYGEWEILKNPSQTEDGERQAVCSVCGDVLKETVPKIVESDEVLQGGGTDSYVTKEKTDSSNRSNGDNSSDTATKASDNPQTGDTTVIWVYILPVVLSIIVAEGIRRKRFSR